MATKEQVLYSIGAATVELWDKIPLEIQNEIRRLAHLSAPLDLFEVQYQDEIERILKNSGKQHFQYE